jgi:hypothetical protein
MSKSININNILIEKDGFERESGYYRDMRDDMEKLGKNEMELELNWSSSNLEKLLGSIRDFVNLQNLIIANKESSSIPFKQDEKTGFTDATPEVFDSLNAKHKDFIQSRSLKHVLNLLYLANYLQMDNLVDLISLFIAMYIKQIIESEGGNAPQKIREIFGITYTFKDKDEEQRIIDQNKGIL